MPKSTDKGVKPMKQFLKFLTKLKSFWKLYQNYGYDGEAVGFIINNYEGVYVTEQRQ